MRLNLRSISLQLALLAATTAVVVAFAAGAMVWSFRLAESRIEAALASQQRLDLWSNTSAAITRYTLSALDAANGAGRADAAIEETRSGVRASFQSIERAIAEGVAAAPTETTKTAIANRGRLLNRLVAGFDVLDRQIVAGFTTAPVNPDDIRGALNGFAATFAPTLSGAMDDERRTATRIRDDMRALGGTLAIAGVCTVIAGIVLAYGLFRIIARPLVTRIGEMGAFGRAIGRGDLGNRLPTGNHDELGLAIAIFNRTAARLQRREAGITADRNRLEAIISERTADLTAANSRLGAIDTARQRFFADVSHELRTPLTVILGECDLIGRRDAPEPDRIRESLATIANRARRLHRRVEDLLRIARSKSGEIDLMPSTAPVADVLGEAIEDTMTLARRKVISLHVDTQPPDLEATVDRDWLRQVIEGLVVNAVRYSPEGGRIDLLGRRRDGGVTIEVRDHGTGIAKDDLPHVFKRFYRGDNAGGGLGFGIGLSLAKWVVERSDGTIEIESRSLADMSPNGTAGSHIAGTPISGTTIRLILPAAPISGASQG